MFIKIIPNSSTNLTMFKFHNWETAKADNRINRFITHLISDDEYSKITGIVCKVLDVQNNEVKECKTVNNNLFITKL